MSFNIYSRKVRNVHLPIAHRRSAIECNTFLEKIRAFERKRIREKHRGQRHPCKKDVELLDR